MCGRPRKATRLQHRPRSPAPSVAATPGVLPRREPTAAIHGMRCVCACVHEYVHTAQVSTSHTCTYKYTHLHPHTHTHSPKPPWPFCGHLCLADWVPSGFFTRQEQTLWVCPDPFRSIIVVYVSHPFNRLTPFCCKRALHTAPCLCFPSIIPLFWTHFSNVGLLGGARGVYDVCDHI